MICHDCKMEMDAAEFERHELAACGEHKAKYGRTAVSMAEERRSKQKGAIMKQEFEMTREEMDDILAINKNQSPVMKFGDYWSGMDLQEKVNHYWETLGKKYGFTPLSVEGSSKGELFFLAISVPIVKPKTSTELAMDKFDTLESIVVQLESCYTGDAARDIAGDIGMNVAFMSLRKMAGLTPKEA